MSVKFQKAIICPESVHHDMPIPHSLLHTHSFCVPLSELPLLSIPPKTPSLLLTKHPHKDISLLQQPSGPTLHPQPFK